VPNAAMRQTPARRLKPIRSGRRYITLGRKPVCARKNVCPVPRTGRFSEEFDKVADSDDTHQHCELPHQTEALMVEGQYSVRVATPADADAVTALLLRDLLRPAC
jgi:hypothetical protein